MNKENVINDLKKLKDVLEHLECITEDNRLYKPLEQKEIDLLEQAPTLSYFNDIFLYNIKDKVENIVNKCCINNNFKTLITKEKVYVYYVDDLNLFCAIRLDLSTIPPQLESNIYDIELLIKELESFDILIKKSENKKQELLKQLKLKNLEFEEMSKKEENFVKKVNYESFMLNDEKFLFISKIDKQKIEIDKIINQINELNCKIQIYSEKKINLQNLSVTAASINLNDFVELREKLETELGIDLNCDAVMKNIVIDQFSPKGKIYTIGDKYPIRYIKNTKNFSD